MKIGSDSSTSSLKQDTASPLMVRDMEQTRVSLSPTAQAVKSLEMSARRGLAFAALHARHLEMQGNEVLASVRKPEMWDSRIRKLGLEVWGQQWYSSPSYLQYEWCFNYWLQGGHDRGLRDILAQLPDPNRKRVIKTMTQYE